MSTPFLGRGAIVKKDATEIGYAVGVRTSIDADIIRAYKIGSDKPVVLESGNKRFRVTVDKMFIDNIYATAALQGTKLSIELQAATGSGKPKITLSNVVLSSWELTVDQDGVIMESVEGEGDNVTIGTST